MCCQAGFGKLLVNKTCLYASSRVASQDGMSPLQWAAHRGRAAVVTYLVGHGADIEAKDVVSGDTSEQPTRGFDEAGTLTSWQVKG